MKKHRLLSFTLCLILALSTVVSSVFASGFTDVDTDPTVAWAKTYIDQMTASGYIKGYEDGTFKPKRAISKLECLLLMSRMLGVEEDEYANISDRATEAYGTLVKKYNTTYVNELCYLLYSGILTEKDLVSYASAANANTELLRYDAAILMAKLLGQNTAANNFKVSSATYADDSKIPTSAKSYVEYVSSLGIMNGMDSDENGNPQFSPSTSLTRAQMATLLARMIDKIDKTRYTGTIDELMLDNNTIAVEVNSKVTNYTVNADTIVYLDGNSEDVTALADGDEIEVLEINKHIQLIDVLSSNPSDTASEKTSIYAVISQASESAAGIKITLADPEDSENAATYTAAENCQYIVNGTLASYSNLRKGQLVKATVSNGKLIAVETMEQSMTVSGTLDKIEFDDDNHVYLTVIDSAGNSQMYVVSNKGATIIRGGSAAEYRELSSGDSVTLQLTKGKVVKITATAISTKFSGVLSEIILATHPRVTLLIDGKAETYYLRSDAVITIAGTTSTIYDLRPNVTVTGTLDGEEVKTLVASSVSNNEKGEFSGTVFAINTTYKVITVMDTDGSTHSVYYNSNTNFLKSDGSSTTAKSVEKGASVSITGADSNGVFVAAIVIIK